MLNKKQVELISYYESMGQKYTEAILSKLSAKELNDIYFLYKQAREIEKKFANNKLQRHKELEMLWYQYEHTRLQDKFTEMSKEANQK